VSNSYYYTLASLPFLQIDDRLPFSRDFFLQLCETTISNKDYLEILNTTIDIPEDDSLLGNLALQYWSWERTLRNYLVKARAKEMDVEGTAFIRDENTSLDIEEIAVAATKQNTPLDAELFLAQKRWEYIDSLRNVNYFSFENLQVWYLQFQILERLNVFDEEEGFNRYSSLYQEILKGQNESSELNEVNNNE